MARDCNRKQILGLGSKCCSSATEPYWAYAKGHTMNGNLILLSFQQAGSLYDHNQFDLSTIKEFRLQTRPYEWAEFKHIHLTPTL